MTASLKHNIAAMKESKRLPHFVQVLVTLEEALAEIEQLRTDYSVLKVDYDTLRQELADVRELLREAASEIDELGFPSVADTYLSKLDPKP